MKTAAIYDIHGNIPALEAVLAEIRKGGFDLVVIGGDIVPGPSPAETLEMLRGLEIPTRFIRGNGDRAVSETKAGIVSTAVPERARPNLEWCAGQLTVEQCELLGSLPAIAAVEIAGIGAVLFCHATPRNDTEIFTRLTAEAKLLPIFENANASTVVCGHTHMQFDRMVGSKRVVNAGSVGAPFGLPGAYWLALGPTVELQRTEYDYQAAASALDLSDYPAKQAVAEGIVKPPPEEQMLNVFSEAEL